MTQKVYRFATDERVGRGYRLAVHATSLAAAREYVRNQATSSLTHRKLKYQGEGPPPNPEGWTGAVVRS